MREDVSKDQKISVSVPMGVLAAGLVMGLAGAIGYTILNRGEEIDAPESGRDAGKTMKSTFRKFGITTFIGLIENDKTRKLVVSMLRLVAKRA